jgi:hypothetical protein
LLLCVPFIPGLRDIPRLIPVHRLIWRHWDGPAPEPASGNIPAPEPTAGNIPAPEPAAGNIPAPEPAAGNIPAPEPASGNR